MLAEVTYKKMLSVEVYGDNIIAADGNYDVFDVGLCCARSRNMATMWSLM